MIKSNQTRGISLTIRYTRSPEIGKTTTTSSDFRIDVAASAPIEETFISGVVISWTAVPVRYGDADTSSPVNLTWPTSIC